MLLLGLIYHPQSYNEDPKGCYYLMIPLIITLAIIKQDTREVVAANTPF